MAKEAAAEEATEQPPKKKKLLLIIIIAVVVVVLAGTGVAVYLLTSKPAAEEQADVQHEEEAAEEEEHYVYEKLETFTVNLADQESYLQIEISLKLADAKVQDKLKKRMPEIRDVLLRLLSGKTPDELMTPDGKEQLAKEVQKEVNGVIGAKKADKGVVNVLFTSFIIQ